MNTTLSTIYELAVKLLEPLSEQETYKTIVQEAIHLTGAKHGTLYLSDKKGGFNRAYTTLPPELQVEPRKKGYAYETYKTRTVRIVNFRELKRTHPEKNYPSRRYIAMIPLSYGRKSMGVLVLHTEKFKNPFPKKIRILELFGSMATLKIRNNMLFAETKTAVETRDLFISMASHELKTPLTTISAYAQLIEKKVRVDQDINPEWLVVLNKATLRMTRLINELLHVNQIKTGKLPYKFGVCNLEEVAKYAVTEFKSSYKGYSIQFINEIKDRAQTEVRGDFDKLIQVVTNLLNNAAKFSPIDKPIILKLYLKGNKVCLSVSDQGKGIAEHHLPFLFTEFYKVDHNYREGLGLGLFISKKIMEAHRGTIKVESKEGKGSTFHILIPSANVHDG